MGEDEGEDEDVAIEVVAGDEVVEEEVIVHVRCPL